MVSLPDKTVVPAKFSDNFMGTDQDVSDLTAPRPETRWCLVELPAKDIETLSKGSTYYFQSIEGGTGLDDGGAALSTETETFSLEFLENSNSLFLAQVTENSEAPAGSPDAPPAGEAAAEAGKAMGYACEVFGQVRGHLLTKPTPVNKQRLVSLLSQQPLGAKMPEPALTLDALAYKLAASRAELLALLKDGPYVEVGGVWRIVPTPLEREILDVVVNVVAAKDWGGQKVNRDALLKEVQQHMGEDTVPTWSVLDKVMKSLWEVPKDTGSEVHDEALMLDKGKVAQFQALQLLRKPPQQVRDRFNLPEPQPLPKRPRHSPGFRDFSSGMILVDEFASILQELTGAAEKPSTDDIMKVLGDQAYLDEFEGSLHNLDPSSLPPDPRERLKRLFALQSHWNQGRLVSLVAPTLGAGVKVDVWVLKNARQVFVEVAGKEERFLTKKFGM